MANYRQYTQCVDIGDFNPANPYTQAALIGLYVTLPAAVIPVLMVLGGGNPWCLALLAEIFLIAGIIGYCYWWLFRRLICIPATPDHPNDSTGNQMVIGTLIDTLPPYSDSNPLDIDNDFSMGILPACIPLGAQGPFTAANPAPGPFGYLITEQPVTRTVFRRRRRHSPDSAPSITNSRIPARTSARRCCTASLKVLLYTTCSAAGPHFSLWLLRSSLARFQVYGWIVALILALLGLLSLGIGLGLGHFDSGDPTDVNPNLGELHTNGPDHTGASVLMIMGHWVCDAGHRRFRRPLLLNFIPSRGAP